MLVKNYRFNEEKLNRMIVKREAAYAAFKRLSDRLQDVRYAMLKARGHLERWRHKNYGDAPAVLTDPVNKFTHEYESVSAEHELAKKQWHAIAEVVTPLEEAAAEWRNTTIRHANTEVVGAGQREATRDKLFMGL